MSPVILKAGQYREPDAPAAETLIQPLDGRSGYAFGFWQVRPGKEVPEALNALLLDHVLRLAAGFDTRANAQHRFEQFLRALNEALRDGVRDGVWTLPIGELHALVGIACDGQIFFSGTGDLSALYMHRRPTGHYQVYNLFRGIQTEQSLPSWEKAFAVVLDGDLSPGDVLCVSNNDVQRQLPADDLHRYLSTLPPGSAAEKIRQHFPARTDLSLLILQVHDASPFILERATPHTDLSVAHMTETEATTDRLLEDQGPDFFGALKHRFFKRPAATAGTARPLAVRLISVGKIALRSVVSAMRWVGRTGQGLVKARNGRDVKDALLGRIRRVPRSHLYLLAAIVGLVLIISLSVSLAARGQANAKAEASYKTAVTAIEERRDQAAAAIIYRDEGKSLALYAEMETLLKALPVNTPERATKAEALKVDLAAGLDQIRHVVNIPAPPLKADLATLDGAATGTSLLADGGVLYVFGSDKKVYRLDAASRAFVRLDTQNGAVGAAHATASENGATYFLDDRPGISRFDATHLQQQVTDVKITDAPWADIDLYGKKLYVLAPGTNDGQVIRFAKTDSGFGQGSGWIKAKSTSLADGVSLAVDGTVYVLKKNGVIVRFASGNEVGWAVAPVDPPVAAATRLWTDAASDYVYVLEPAGHRVIVYAKQTGASVTQYRSDAFTDLTDFHVDEKNRLIYLLSGTKLYAINASHLK